MANEQSGKGIKWEEHATTTLRIGCGWCQRWEMFHRYSQGLTTEGHREELLAKAARFGGWKVYEGHDDVPPAAACKDHHAQLDRYMEEGPQ